MTPDPATPPSPPEPPPAGPVLLPTPRARRGLHQVSLTAKVMLNSLLIATVVSVTLISLASWQYGRQMKDRFIELGTSVAKATAAGVERSPQDWERLSALVASGRGVSGVRYLLVQAPDGRVLAHSFQEGLPAALQALGAQGQGGVREDVRFQQGERTEKAIDVMVPVKGGQLGAVHVGMNQAGIDEAVGGMRGLLVLAALLAGLLGVGMGAGFMAYAVVRPLKALTRAASHIARTGDLTARVEVHAQDELGELAASFEHMVSRLREVLASLQLASGAVIEMTSALTRSAEEQREMVTRQAASLQETQVTAQEIQQTSLMAAQKAELVLEVAARAEGLGTAGEAAVDQSLAELVEVRTQVETISERMRQLGERTRQIGGITQTVKDLADQSNMLALNAAIEAVRSGEHGKGFGVVAREIRSLADQSIQSTDRVRDILEDISTAIAAAVELSATGSERMEAGLVQVRTTGDSIRALGDIVRTNLSAARQIGAAVSQQNAGIQQVFTALTDLSGLMEETVARINATSQAAQSLQEVSAQLADLARSYRTGTA